MNLHALEPHYLGTHSEAGELAYFLKGGQLEAITVFLRADDMWKTKQVKGDVSFDLNISNFELLI